MRRLTIMFMALGLLAAGCNSDDNGGVITAPDDGVDAADAAASDDGSDASDDSSALQVVTLFFDLTPGAVPDGGDEAGGGSVEIQLDPATGDVCYELRVTGLADLTAAHIHQGAPDTTGPVIVPLDAPDTDGSSSGCAEADPAVIDALRGGGAGYYVNVHSSSHPDGAVRADLGT